MSKYEKTRTIRVVINKEKILKQCRQISNMKAPEMVFTVIGWRNLRGNCRRLSTNRKWKRDSSLNDLAVSKPSCKNQCYMQLPALNLSSINVEIVDRNDCKGEVLLLEKEKLIPDEGKVCRQGSLDKKYKLQIIHIQNSL